MMMGTEYRIDDLRPLQAKHPETGEMVDILFWKVNGVVLIHPKRKTEFARAFTFMQDVTT